MSYVYDPDSQLSEYFADPLSPCTAILPLLDVSSPSDGEIGGEASEEEHISPVSGNRNNLDANTTTTSATIQQLTESSTYDSRFHPNDGVSPAVLQHVNSQDAQLQHITLPEMGSELTISPFAVDNHPRWPEWYEFPADMSDSDGEGTTEQQTSATELDTIPSETLQLPQEMRDDDIMANYPPATEHLANGRFSLQDAQEVSAPINHDWLMDEEATGEIASEQESTDGCDIIAKELQSIRRISGKYVGGARVPDTVPQRPGNSVQGSSSVSLRKTKPLYPYRLEHSFLHPPHVVATIGNAAYILQDLRCMIDQLGSEDPLKVIDSDIYKEYCARAADPVQEMARWNKNNDSLIIGFVRANFIEHTVGLSDQERCFIVYLSATMYFKERMLQYLQDQSHGSIKSAFGVDKDKMALFVENFTTKAVEVGGRKRLAYNSGLQIIPGALSFGFPDLLLWQWAATIPIGHLHFDILILRPEVLCLELDPELLELAWEKYSQSVEQMRLIREPKQRGRSDFTKFYGVEEVRDDLVYGTEHLMTPRGKRIPGPYSREMLENWIELFKVARLSVSDTESGTGQETEVDDGSLPQEHRSEE
jgi:hypothetical protein